MQSPLLKQVGEEPLRDVLRADGDRQRRPARPRGRRGDADVEDARPAAARARQAAEPARPGAVRVPVGGRLPAVRMGRRRSALHADAPPVHEPRPRPTSRLLDSAPGEVRARAYDLVLNGSEIGGGSIRIHDQAVQARIFRLLNITRRGREGAVRLLPRGARARDAAARRHRARARPYRRAAVRRAVDPRGHRVPEDGRGRRHHGGRAVAGRREAAAGVAHRPPPLPRLRDRSSEAGSVPAGGGCGFAATC